MYFPESAALLEVLWRAKMSLCLEDIDFQSFPRAFSIAWPRCEIEGVSLPGTLVTVMTMGQYRQAYANFGFKHLGYPVAIKNDGTRDDETYGICVSYSTGRTAMDSPIVCRAAIPAMFLQDILSSEGSFKTIGSLGDKGYLGVVDLTDEEKHQQYVLTRLIAHLMVYMQACPEHVRDGFPEGRKDKEFNCVTARDIDGSVIGAPAGLGGTHASPFQHWRTWYFRSYPRRKDGTKQRGVVKVSGTMVMADVDPRTVEYEIGNTRPEAHPQGVVIGH